MSDCRGGKRHERMFLCVRDNRIGNFHGHVQYLDLGSSYTGILEKEMAIHSSTLGWKIPWTEEPGRLQSMGLQRVGHD